MKHYFITLVAVFLTSCATYSDIKEIKLIGFTEDLHRGKSSVSLKADDCLYSLFGYALGSRPEISQAIANAQTGKESRVQDVAVGSQKTGKNFRYVNNLTTKYSGFSAGFFSKTCIEAKGVGYL